MVIFLMVGLTAAQSGLPAFDVASVKPSHAATGNMQLGPGGRVEILASTLKSIIRWAYDIGEYQVLGGPPWLDADQWDIIGKPPSDATLAQAREMLRTLLAERFQLVIHRDRKERSTFVLAVGKNGPKLQASASDTPVRGLSVGRNGRMNGAHVITKTIAVALSRLLDTVVLDETGLTGEYDIALSFSPPGRAPIAGDDRPSVFTAFKEQAGLELVARKEMVEMLVIDRAERASAN